MTRGRVSSFVGVLAGVAMVTAGCGSADSGGATPDASGKASVSSDPNAVLDVWVDATRQPAAQAFAKANPAVKTKITLIPADQANYVSTKVQLANKAGAGWPDVAFLADSGEIAALQAAPLKWAAPLNDLVPDSVRSGFAASSVKNCTFGGKAYCLQNDLAQTVLWYDKSMMTSFGYEVPTTWQDYAALGARVAKEHPGYVIGSMEGRLGLDVYYAASGCPFSAVTAPDTVKINLSDPKCTRVTELLQPLLDNGSVSRKGLFDAAFVKLATSGKLLMLPSASWMGDFGFKPLYKVPQGKLAAAPMPKWDGEESAWSGAIGGGVWAVSQHTKNAKGAADLITYVTTDTGVQTASPTYPAFGQAATAWLAKKASDTYYAADPTPALKAQADLINPAFNWVRYNAAVSAGADATVGKGLASGKALSDVLADWQKTLVSGAEDAGYTVVSE